MTLLSRRALFRALSGARRQRPKRPRGSGFLSAFYAGRSPEPLPTIAVRAAVVEIDHQSSEPHAELSPESSDPEEVS